MAHARRRSPRILFGLALSITLAVGSLTSAQAVILFADGFESGTSTAWTRVNAFTVQRTTVATGTWAGRAASTGTPSWAWRSLGSDQQEIYLRVRVFITARSGPVWFQYARAGSGGGIAAVGVNAAGMLVARNIVTATTYASQVSVSAGVWHEVELHALMGSSGRLDVWLDQQLVSSLSRSQSFGTARIGRVMIGDVSTNRTFDLAFDDVTAATTRVGQTDTSAPSVPTGLVATAGGASRIDLVWQPSTDDVSVAGYDVSRSQDGVSFQPVGSTGATTFSDAGLSADTTYTYVVAAFDAAGNRSEPSAPASATTQASPPSSTQPNIVFVLTDDQPADTIDRMPTVQSELVAKGVTFTNGVVSNSLCCPSRSSILRGQYSHTTGVYDNGTPFGGYSSFRSFGLHRSTIGTWLDDAGYETGYLGKLMNGYSANDVMPGWDFWAGTTASYYNYGINVNGVRTTEGSSAADYHTTVMTELADRFIRGADPNRPLFLQVAPFAPHAPYTPAPQYATDPRCTDATNTDAISFNEADVSDKPLYIRSKGGVDVQSVGITRPVAQCRTLLSVDDLVATVLRALEDTGRLDDTLIVYMGDNGLMNGEHRWPNKEVPYEGAVRVPFVMRFDPLTAGAARADHHLVANIDLAPTFVDLAGVSVTPGCPSPPYGGVCSGTFDGMSLLPLLRQESGSWRPEGILLEHYAQNAPAYCGVRTATMKYVRYTTGEEELYDLVADPGEMTNMLGDGSITITDQALRESFRTRLFGVGGWCIPPPPTYAPP